MFGSILLTLLCISGALSATLGPCKKEDRACISKVLGKAFPDIIKGVPSRGVSSSDPIFQEAIDVDISILKYKFINTSTRGFSNCVLTKHKLDLDALKFYYEIECPSLSMHGKYEMKGRLILIDVEGKGTYDIITSKYWCGVEADVVLYKKDGKTYLKLTNSDLQLKALGPVKFDFKHLFNGRQDLSDAVHKFAHENWQEVASLTDKPVFTQNLKYVTKNFNRYLKFEPLEEVIIGF